MSRSLDRSRGDRQRSGRSRNDRGFLEASGVLRAAGAARCQCAARQFLGLLDSGSFAGDRSSFRAAGSQSGSDEFNAEHIPADGEGPYPGKTRPLAGLELSDSICFKRRPGDCHDVFVALGHAGRHWRRNVAGRSRSAGGHDFRSGCGLRSVLAFRHRHAT